MQSHFFALLNRLRWIKRWGLMRNAYQENVMEHSWEVAVIAHALAVIKNTHFNGRLDANAITVAALYHDVTEVMTGDLPTPVKYYSPEINQSYKTIEKQAEQNLLNLLPDSIQPVYDKILQEHQRADSDNEIIKAADKISAYLKCYSELKAGNQEFAEAAAQLKQSIEQIDLPEVDFFMDKFVAGYGMSLDKLMQQQSH